MATSAGQSLIEEHITDEIELLVLDNLSSLVRSGIENDAESWQALQDWLLRLRANGKSVLLNHNSGKTGQQRGTSRREDVLDVVIYLKHPSDYAMEQGARFEVHFGKARRLYGADTKPFEARLINTPHGGQRWLVQDVQRGAYGEVVALSKEGLNQKDIAKKVGIDQSTVSRHLAKAKKEGEI